VSACGRGLVLWWRASRADEPEPVFVLINDIRTSPRQAGEQVREKRFFDGLPRGDAGSGWSSDIFFIFAAEDTKEYEGKTYRIKS